MTPAAKVLLQLAERVTGAERELEKGPLYWVNSRAERVAKALAEGENMNSLGELQSTGPGFDVAIATLEAYASAFATALRALQGEPLDQGESDWLDHIIDGSPRLTNIRRQIIKEMVK